MRRNSGKKDGGFVAALLVIAAVPLFWAAGSSAEGELASISFRRVAWVSEPEIRLAAVAHIETSNEELGRWLSSISLGAAPSPRQTKELSRDYVLARLHLQQVDLSSTVVEVPERIQVTRAYAVVPPERFRELFVRYVATNSPWHDARIEVERVEPTVELAVPHGVVTCRVSPPRQQHLMGKVELPVTVLVDGVVCDKLRLTGYVRVIQRVVHTGQPVHRGNVIAQGDVILQDADISLLRPGYFTDMSHVIGKRARRDIRAHEVIEGKVLELVPLVRRGDMVSLLVDNRFLRVMAPGRMGEDGYPGQLVKVLNVSSNRYVYGRMVDARTVNVEY